MKYNRSIWLIQIYSSVPRLITEVTAQPVADLSALDRCRVTGWMWPFTAVVKAAQSGCLLLLAGQIRLHDYSRQTIKWMKALQWRFSCNKIWWAICWTLKSWFTDTAKNVLQYGVSVTFMSTFWEIIALVMRCHSHTAFQDTEITGLSKRPSLSSYSGF